MSKQEQLDSAMEGLKAWAAKDNPVTDSRPEITVRTNGAFVVVRIPDISYVKDGWTLVGDMDIPLSTEEALDLEERLRGAAMSIMHTIALDGQRAIVNEAARPAKSWRDREPML